MVQSVLSETEESALQLGLKKTEGIAAEQFIRVTEDNVE